MVFFGVLAILLCIAMAIETPGVLLFLLILATPALIRTAVVLNRAAARPSPNHLPKNEPGSAPSFLRTFLSSVGVLAVVGLVSVQASSAAFIVACFPAAAVSAGLNSVKTFVIIAGSTSLIAPLVVAYWLLWRFWSRKT